jgi:hypothetical protein
MARKRLPEEPPYPRTNMWELIAWHLRLSGINESCPARRWGAS